MESSKINQALIELEENLRNVESARNQVNDVSQKSELLIVSFDKLLKLLETLPKEFDLNEEGMLGTINKSMIVFEENVNKESIEFALIIKKNSDLIKLAANDVQKQIQLLINTLLTQIENLRKVEYGKKLELVIQNLSQISKNLDMFIQFTRNAFDNLGKQISNSDEKNDNYQLKIIDELKNIIQELRNNLNVIKFEIKELAQNLIFEFEKISNKISEISSDLNEIKVSNEELNIQVKLLKTETTQLSENVIKISNKINRQTLWNRFFIIAGILGIMLFELLLKSSFFSGLIRLLK